VELFVVVSGPKENSVCLGEDPAGNRNILNLHKILFRLKLFSSLAGLNNLGGFRLLWHVNFGILSEHCFLLFLLFFCLWGGGRKPMLRSSPLEKSRSSFWDGWGRFL